jgi:hypothetical protein
MSLREKVKTGLDETRLLILGAQVFFGFKLNGVFQEAFPELSPRARLFDCAGQVLMAITIGLLIAPSMQHRIVEKGPRIRSASIAPRVYLLAWRYFPSGLALASAFTSYSTTSTVRWLRSSQAPCFAS